MNRRWLVGILVALVVITGAALLAGYAYSAGVAQGVVQGAASEGQAIGPNGPYPYHYGGPGFFYGPAFGPWGFGFGLLRCLFPLLGILLIFALLRSFMWRRPWGWGGRWHGEPGEHSVPPAFAEWHRRAHGEPARPDSPPPAG